MFTGNDTQPGRLASPEGDELKRLGGLYEKAADWASLKPKPQTENHRNGKETYGYWKSIHLQTRR
jgi:hypothetical protein